MHKNMGIVLHPNLKSAHGKMCAELKDVHGANKQPSKKVRAY